MDAFASEASSRACVTLGPRGPEHRTPLLCGLSERSAAASCAEGNGSAAPGCLWNLLGLVTGECLGCS